MNSKSKSIFFMILSAIGFTFMGVFIKKIPDVPIYEKLFFRNIVILFITLFTIIKKKKSILIDKNVVLPLFGRCIFGLIGVVCNFYAIQNLVIADANMINKLSPIFVLIIAGILLKEKITSKQIICIFIMLISSTLVIKPQINSMFLPSIIGLVGAIFAALAYIMIRFLKNLVDSDVIILYFSATTILSVLPLVVFNFHYPSLYELIILFCIGICGFIGQIGLTIAYFYAPASEVSVYNYVAIPISIILGYIFFNEIPDYYSLIAGVIIILTAYYLYISKKKNG